MKLTTRELTLCAVLTALALALSYMENFILGSLFAGNLNALIFSLMGGVTAMLVMILLSHVRGLSVYGVSVGGAAAHNCGQVAAAILTLGNTAPLYYLPVLLGVSIFSGALTGLIAVCLFRALAYTELMKG